MLFRRKRDAPAAPSRDAPAPLPVCGLGRSGGTIFLEALSRHPEIVVCPRWPHEQRPAAWLVSARARLRLRDGSPERPDPPASEYKNGRSPFSSREGDLERDYAELALARVDAAVRDGGCAFYARLAARLEKPAARFFSEKVEPYLLRDYVEAFGDVKVLVLVRDPRDALVSSVEWFARRGGDETSRAERPTELRELLDSRWTRVWKEFPAALDWARRTGVELLVVRYEDLVREPLRTFERVQQFAGLSAADGAALAAAAVLEPPIRETHLTSASAASSIGRWRRELDGESQAALASAVEEVAAAFGYE